MNFYEILKTKKLGRGFPDYWTQLFAEHVGGKGEWKVSGVLPLTFTAKAGNALDWVIYGNDDNGTENLFDVSKFAGGNTHAVVGGVSLDVSNQTVIANSTSNKEYPQVYLQSAYEKDLQLEELETYTISLYKENVPIGSSIYLHLRASYNGGDERVFDRIDDTKTITIPSGWTDWKQLLILQGNGLTYENCKIRIDIVKGSIAPDHYIPYQQGVGERTENLFDASKVVNRTIDGHTFVSVEGNTVTISVTNSTNTPDGLSSKLKDIIGNSLEVGKTYTLSAASTGTNKQIYILGTGANFAWTFGTSKTFSTSEEVEAALNGVIRWYASGNNSTATITNIMLTEGSTPPTTYIPCGYQIPLIVSQTGQTDKNYDIYIGNSPLTEGETVSKQSTGIDLELFEGENVVSTTLYNKPTMEIKYKKRR